MLGSVKFIKKKLLICVLVSLLVLNIFYVSSIADFEGRPDLKIDSVNFSKNIGEGEKLDFSVKIKNIVNSETGEFANISSGETIVVALNVDGVLVASKSSNAGLKVGNSIFINLSWTAVYAGDGKRSFSIVVNPGNTISESNVNNNFWDGFIYVSEKETDFEIVDIQKPENFVYNQKSNILVTVKNNGAKSTKPVSGLFKSSKQGNIEKNWFNKTVKRDETFVFSFNWTPNTLGSQSYSITITYNDKSHDVFSESIVVAPGLLEWWNENWHYRYFLSVEKTGVFSKFFNFTELLEDLDLSGSVFENNTLRVVKYYNNGTVDEVVGDFFFNESESFDPVFNATGTLFWDVIGSSGVKFYCIYFDVTNNSGVRTTFVENETISVSGGVKIVYEGYVQGWAINVLQPLNDDFLNVNGTLDFRVKTDSKAEAVKVFCYNLENISHNFTFYLNDIENNTIWNYSNVSFDLQGNWSLEFYAWDWAGYNASVKTVRIYVGKPDLEVKSITAPSNAYLNDVVSVKSSIYCYNSNLYNVSVLFSVLDSNDKLVYSKLRNIDFLKNKFTNISFEYKANVSGNFTFKVFVDYNKTVDELNESNNFLTKKIKVYNYPDLAVLDIYWTDATVMERSLLSFSVIVENKGVGDAVDYIMKLYVEPESAGVMKYETVKDTVSFSLKSKENDTFSLVWDNCNAGRFFVGVKIFVNDTKKDADITNNRLLSDKVFVVSAYERVKPLIKDVLVTPFNQETSGVVEISAYVSDDSGLSLVEIKIKNPNGSIVVSDSMFRTSLYRFRYVFAETQDIGRYNFEIIAKDASPIKNNNSYFGFFEIISDITPPFIEYVGAEPFVQLVDEELSIVCIAYDNDAIASVQVVIYPYEGIGYEQDLVKVSSKKYVYKDVYNETGCYSYYLRVIDESDNIVISDTKKFCITHDLNDSDSDGIPDWWEKRYGFDPYDASDADKDFDNDGLSNIIEYQAGANPIKEVPMQNISYRIRSNIGYIIISFICLFVIFLIVYFGRKRK
jgi:hypothetical protein